LGFNIRFLRSGPCTTLSHTPYTWFTATVRRWFLRRCGSPPFYALPGSGYPPPLAPHRYILVWFATPFTRRTVRSRWTVLVPAGRFCSSGSFCRHGSTAHTLPRTACVSHGWIYTTHHTTLPPPPPHYLLCLCRCCYAQFCPPGLPDVPDYARLPTPPLLDYGYLHRCPVHTRYTCLVTTLPAYCLHGFHYTWVLRLRGYLPTARDYLTPRFSCGYTCGYARLRRTTRFAHTAFRIILFGSAACILTRYPHLRAPLQVPQPAGYRSSPAHATHLTAAAYLHPQRVVAAHCAPLLPCGSGSAYHRCGLHLRHTRGNIRLRSYRFPTTLPRLRAVTHLPAWFPHGSALMPSTMPRVYTLHTFNLYRGSRYTLHCWLRFCVCERRTPSHTYPLHFRTPRCHHYLAYDWFATLVTFWIFCYTYAWLHYLLPRSRLLPGSRLVHGRFPVLFHLRTRYTTGLLPAWLHGLPLLPHHCRTCAPTTVAAFSRRHLLPRVWFTTVYRVLRYAHSTHFSSHHAHLSYMVYVLLDLWLPPFCHRRTFRVHRLVHPTATCPAPACRTPFVPYTRLYVIANTRAAFGYFAVYARICRYCVRLAVRLWAADVAGWFHLRSDWFTPAARIPMHYLRCYSLVLHLYYAFGRFAYRFWLLAVYQPVHRIYLHYLLRHYTTRTRAFTPAGSPPCSSPNTRLPTRLYYCRSWCRF